MGVAAGIASVSLSPGLLCKCSLEIVLPGPSVINTGFV